MADDKRITKKEKVLDFKRHLIMESAWKVFDEKGFLNTTMQDIAEEADFALGTIYKLFNSKEEIMVSQVKLKLVEYHKILLDADNSDSPAIDRLRTILEKMYEYFIDNRKVLQLFNLNRWSGEVNLIRILADECSDQIAELQDGFRDIFKKGYEEGLYREIDLRKANLFVKGIVMEFLWDQILNGPKWDSKKFADEVIELTLNGIGNPKRKNIEEV